MAAKRSEKDFESSLKELECIVKQLEKGELSLDDSIKVFQEGMLLSKELGEILDGMEKKISILLENEEGIIEEENFIEIGDEKGEF